MNKSADPTPEESATEKGYISGSHAAWRQVLWMALGRLNINPDNKDAPLRELARVTGLLEDVRAALRRLCADIGAEFDEELCLVDVIEKIIAPRIPDEDDEP